MSRGLLTVSTVLLTAACARAAGIQWGPCDPSKGIPANLTCAFFPIPLDYHNASAGTGRISVIRANATGPRKGTIFVNPGGPGGSGITYLVESGADLLYRTGGQYDIVSWDPRGVGNETIPGPNTCFDTQADHDAFWSGTIEVNHVSWTGNFTDQEDIDALYAQAPTTEQKYREYGQRCLNHADGTHLRYIGTAANVRDLVALADAIEGPANPINYWGVSYGTLMGNWFVNMFPNRVGRVIVDSVVNVVDVGTQESYMAGAHSIRNGEKLYNAWSNACALAGPSNCAVTMAGWKGQDVRKYIETVVNASYIADRTGRAGLVSSWLFRSAVELSSFVPASWSNNTNTLLPPLISAIQFETGTLIPGPVPLIPISKRELFSVITPVQDAVKAGPEAIYCADSGVDPDNTSMLTVFKELVDVTQNVTPMFGALWPLELFYCPFWPARAVERYTGPFNVKPANPVLVIGNTYDPITPFEHAKLVADFWGDRATLVRQNGFGHGTSAQRSTCTANIMRAYFTNGTLPDGDDTVCEIDEDVQMFRGVSTKAVLASIA